MKNGRRKEKQKIWHTDILKVLENELKNAEVIIKDEVDDLKYEKVQSIAEILKRKTVAIKALEEEIVELETNTVNMRQNN